MECDVSNKTPTATIKLTWKLYQAQINSLALIFRRLFGRLFIGKDECQISRIIRINNEWHFLFP